MHEPRFLELGVTPDVEKENIMPEDKYIPCQYLSIIKEEKKKVKPYKTGGPPTNAPMM